MLSWRPVLHSVHLNTAQLLLTFKCENINIPPVRVVMGTHSVYLNITQLILKFKCENTNVPPVRVVMDTCPELGLSKHNFY